MEVPFKAEVHQVLSGLGIALQADTRLDAEIHSCCAALREHLLRLAGSSRRVPLSDASYWKITPVYRFDVLARDIPVVADQLAYAIGFSTLYLPLLFPSEVFYWQRFADVVFWQNIDSGIRLISSGWSRVALLLDLAFDLNLGTKCDLKGVLKTLPKKSGAVLQQPDFKKLKDFRDRELLQLEDKRGRGARHEAVHILSPASRFFFAYLESQLPGAASIPSELQPEARRDMLVKHHSLYVMGVRSALGLISWQWP